MAKLSLIPSAIPVDENGFFIRKITRKLGFTEEFVSEIEKIITIVLESRGLLRTMYFQRSAIFEKDALDVYSLVCVIACARTIAPLSVMARFLNFSDQTVVYTTLHHFDRITSVPEEFTNLFEKCGGKTTELVPCYPNYKLKRERVQIEKILLGSFVSNSGPAKPAKNSRSNLIYGEVIPLSKAKLALNKLFSDLKVPDGTDVVLSNLENITDIKLSMFKAVIFDYAEKNQISKEKINQWFRAQRAFVL